MYNISILMERGKRKMVKGITGQFRLQEIEDLMALTDLLAQIIRNYREAGDEKIADYFQNMFNEVCPVAQRACGCALKYEGVNA